MRQRINENPIVGIAVIGVLGIAVAFLFISRMSSSSAPAPAATTTAATGAVTTTPATATAPTATDSTAAPTTPSAGTTTPPLATPAGAFTAGPGLPKPVVADYQHGKTVVLLVFKRDGIDDREVRGYVDQLSGKQRDVAIFQTSAKHVTDYSRIAVGVDLDRVPAIVVLDPSKKGNKGASTPQATVSYGFHGVGSIEQAIRDAQYKGPENLPSYPR